MRERTSPKTTARKTPPRDPKPAIAPKRVTPADRGHGARVSLANMLERYDRRAIKGD